MDPIRFQRFTLALLLFALFFSVAAYLRLERLHEEDRRLDYGSLQAAAALTEKRLYADAAEEYRHYLGRSDLPVGERRRVMFQLAELLGAKAGDWSDALAVLTRLEALWPDMPDAEVNELRKRMAEALARLGRSQEAARLIRAETAGQTAEARLSKPVARIGEEFINREDFEKKAAEMPRAFRIQLDSPEGRRQALEQWLQQEIIRREAEALDLPRRQEFVEQRREMEELLLRQHLLVDRVLSRVHVDAQAEKYYYEAHADEFRAPGKFQVRAWTFADDTMATEFLGRLRRNEPGAEAAAPAPRVIAESLPPREISRRLGLPFDVSELLRTSSPGDLLGPLESPAGRLVLRLDRVEAGALPPLDQIRSVVRARLLEEKQQAELAAWFQKKFEEYKIRIYEEALD